VGGNTKGENLEAAQKLLADIESGQCNDEAAVACLRILEARDAIVENYITPYDKKLQPMVKQLPIWPWVESVRGFGAGNLVALIGECGDLWSYRSVAAVWKRMGLAVGEDGKRQRKVRGDEAREHGYSPSRRAVAYVLGTCLIKAQRDTDPYKSFYLTEKERQLTNNPKMTKGHAHNRAMRHMVKRLLRDMYGQLNTRRQLSDVNQKRVATGNGRAAPSSSRNPEAERAARSIPRVVRP
jgi:hypothetical protein